MRTNIKLYYAHSKLIYGTQQEIDELEFLKEKFPYAQIICPHYTIGEINDSKDYLFVVDISNDLIVSEFNGDIGFKVFTEISRAFSNNTNVFVLRKVDDKFYLLKVSGLKIINREDYKIHFGRVIV
jgi:hypothetical protein